MPTYEMSLIMRHALARPQLAEAVKASAIEVMDRGGYIRQLQYLGDRSLPQKITKGKGKGQTRGHYFMLTVDIPLKEFETIKDELQRDKNVIRKNFIGVDTTNAARDHLPVQCTLRDELKPPTERPSIKHMMDLGRTRPRFKKFWDPKTGMDFYPFHR